MKNSLRWLLCVAVLTQASVAFAIGETTGRLTGFVFDPTGAPLGEVPVTLTSSMLLQPQTRTSGEDGRYEFANIPPGVDYVLEVNVPGFAAVRQSKIEVNLGRTTTIDIKLNVLTETTAATYEIVEKVNPIMSTDTAQSTTVVTFEKASQTPIFNQVERMASQVAGVGPGNRPSTRGGLSRYGRFFVDGMDTTDVTDGSITAPMNFDAVEQFEIITGGFDAQYNALGAVTNAVTKSGGNTFRYDVVFRASPSFMVAKNAVPGNQPSLNGIYVDNPIKLPETFFYAPVAVVSGPIIKDKLWFSTSAQINLSKRESIVTTIYSPQENRSTDTQTTLARLKLTWQATSKDKVSVAFNYDRNMIDRNIGNGSATLDAESKIDRGGFFVIGNYDHQFTDNLLFQLQTGITHKNVFQGPQKETGLISHFDSTNRVSQFAAGSLGGDTVGNFLTESKSRIQFDPTLLWNLGKHQLKGGVQLSYQRSQQLTGVTDAQRYLDRGGVCDLDNPASFGFCSQFATFYNDKGQLAPQKNEGAVFSTGVFLQDRWNINKYLTLIPGFRIDVGALTANENKPLTTLVGVGPRLAGTWDIQGNRKTIISAHYGRSNDVGTILIAQHGNPALTQVTANFANGTFANCQFGVSSPGCRQTGGARTIANGAPPSVDEVTLGVKREVTEQAAIGLDLTYRRYNNMWVDEETNQLFDVTGTRVVGGSNGTQQSILQAKTSPLAYREYKGADIWVQGTPGNWDLLASYTLSLNNGTVDDYYSSLLVNPRFTQFAEGPVSDDRRHALKGSLSYRTAFGLDLGLRFQYLSGTPLWASYPNPNTTETSRVTRSPRGTGFADSQNVPNLNDASTWSELRNPSQMIVDVQARYNLGQLFKFKETRIDIAALIVNAFNSTEAFSLSDTYSAGTANRFGTATGRQAPFQAQLVLRVRN